jgi:hypothetical protein
MLKLFEVNGKVIAIYVFSTPSGGTVKLCAIADQKAIQDGMAMQLVQRAKQLMAQGQHGTARKLVQRIAPKLPAAAAGYAAREAVIGVTAPEASEWWWRARSARALRKSPDDLAARAAWWNAKSPAEREYDRAMYLGVKAWGLLDKPDQAYAQLMKVGKGGRQRILHRYKTGLWTVTRSIKKVAAPVLDIASKVLPIATTMFPMLAPLGMAAGPALGLLNRAMKGEPIAKAALRTIADGIKRGDPRAMKAGGILQQAFKATKGNPAAALLRGAVSGAELASPGAAAGQWMTARDGQRVYVPAGGAQAGGPMLDAFWQQVRPRYGYRPESEVFGARDAYREGLRAVLSH